MGRTITNTSLDGDGVLLDYNTAYAALWEKVFNVKLTLVRPDGYHAMQRYDLPFLEKDKLEYFNSCKDEEFWSTVPALPGALEACHTLKELGHRLTCVTAVSSKFVEARRHNLEALGFQLDEVLATGTQVVEGASPKAAVLASLAPDRHVDDYYPYFKGISSSIRRILIHRDHYKSPNLSPEALVHSDEQYGSLRDYADSLKSTSCNFK